MSNRFFTFCILLLCLTGCLDKQELEDQSYVMAIGVDATDNKNEYAFTYQIANPEVNLYSGISGDEPPTETFTVKGNDFLNATYAANAFITKEIRLDHAKTIIISEELARSDNFIRVIQSATKTPQLRRGIQIVVSKEKAQTFIDNNKPVTESRIHKFYEAVFSSAMEAGLIPEASFHRFFQITEGDADLFLAVYATTEHESVGNSEHRKGDQYIAGKVPQTGGPTTQFMGSAVFKEGKMIDILNGEETRLAHTLDPTLRMDNYIATIPDPINPEFNITYTYTQQKDAKVKIDYHKDKPTDINVKVHFKVEVNAIPSLIEYPKDIAKQRKLEKTIVARLETKAEKLAKKSQEEYKSDPFYWSLYIRHHFKTIPEYEAADWNKEIFPNANVNVTFELDQLEFGKIISDTQLDETRD